jgi:hypothetical protein
MRSKLERRVGPKTHVAWTQGDDTAGRWIEARWKIPGRLTDVRWRFVRPAPHVLDAEPPQVRLTRSLTTEHDNRRGKHVVSEGAVDTLLLDRGARTEVRFEQS